MDWIEKLKQETFENADRRASCNFGLPDQRIDVQRFTPVNSIYFWRHNNHPIRESEARWLLARMQKVAVEKLSDLLTIFEETPS